MHLIHFITGGVRSGKSAFAEKMALRYDSVYYLATARVDVGDAEMENRILLHQNRRPTHWHTIEQSVDLTPVFASLASDSGCVIVESVGTYLLNAMMDAHIDWDRATRTDRAAFETKLLAEVDAWLAALAGGSIDAVFVSEEVGLSLVSPYAMGRVYADALGLLNQRIAAAADRATLVVSGIAVTLK